MQYIHLLFYFKTAVKKNYSPLKTGQKEKENNARRKREKERQINARTEIKFCQRSLCLSYLPPFLTPFQFSFHHHFILHSLFSLSLFPLLSLLLTMEVDRVDREREGRGGRHIYANTKGETKSRVVVKQLFIYLP